MLSASQLCQGHGLYVVFICSSLFCKKLIFIWKLGGELQIYLAAITVATQNAPPKNRCSECANSFQFDLEIEGNCNRKATFKWGRRRWFLNLYGRANGQE